jgi:YVTN family beta-propeller protein
LRSPPDGTKVYVTDRDDNTVFVIDTTTKTVSTEINVGKQPKALGQFIGYIPVEPRVPVADFSATQTSGNKPLSFNFYDLSTGSPTSWYWDFGDGVTSVEQNPTHTFNEAGNYTVKLTAYNEVSSDSKTQEVIIKESQNEDKILPVADFNVDPTRGNVPLLLNLQILVNYPSLK